MRLTKKLEHPYKRVLGEDYVYTSNTRLTPSFAKVEQKLGQLEDIEDELGIDLIIIFKALKNGIHFKRGNDIRKININYICKNGLGYRGYSLGAYDDDYPDIDICFLFKEYGKTWALTKEELL